MRFTHVTLISACVVLVIHGRVGNAANSNNARIQQGAKIFNDRCASCHNKQPGDDSPFGPPNLHGAFHGHSSLSRVEAENIIENGRNAMPAFGKVLNKTEIASVIAYLQKH
jgi:mono/diheme cytochrome c family protein